MYSTFLGWEGVFRLRGCVMGGVMTWNNYLYCNATAGRLRWTFERGDMSIISITRLTESITTATHYNLYLTTKPTAAADTIS